jgi:RNA ligase (TIGR02306 family)
MIVKRKLASIQIVSDVQPIDGADRIEVARVLNWNVVVGKGEFKAGDKCVYCEIDSVLPDFAEYEFLRKSCYIDKNGFRGFLIKTKKMRGIISQGLVLPLTVEYGIDELAVGTDVTDILGIVKYDPPLPECLGGLAKGNFPSWIPSTDELRIQGTTGVLQRHKGKVFYVTEKIDGVSATYYLKDGEFGVCSRNLELKETESNTYWHIARVLDIEGKLRHFGMNIAIQGEIYGKGIQRNYGLPNQHFRVYSVYDLEKNEYLGFRDALRLVEMLGLDFVPIIYDVLILDEDINVLLKMASEFPSAINDEFDMEGIVVRSYEESTDIELGRLSFKVISNEDLIKRKI